MWVELRRGTVVESRHRIHVAVVDAAGTLVAEAGDPSVVSFWRSAAKPFQALPLALDGAADRFGFDAADLALACASHSSEPAQVERARAMLAKIGCGEADLMCGPHRPLSDAVAADYRRRGVTLSAIHSNCSGKHAGMLALARHHGWPTANYAAVEHPVQRRCVAEVSRWTDVPQQEIGVAVDGCGVATFAIPVRNMALAYARLAESNAERGMRNAELNGEHRAANDPTEKFRISHSAFRILDAMLQHPELIAGSGRPCTEMMRAHPGRLVAKAGAEGIYGAGLVREGLGVAVKVEDGHGPAAALAIAAVLGELGFPMPEGLTRAPVTNSRDETVGELRVNGGLVR